MTDSIAVFPPGQRILDSSGDVISGAVLTFFDAGTSTPRTVYSNSALSTSLGTSVTCDSGGYPTSDGNAQVQVYTGSTPYKVVCKTSAGVTVWSQDNVRGALDTSAFLTSSDITPEFPVSNVSTNQTLAVADQGKVYNINCSGGDVTVLFDNAADLGDGFNVEIRHDGTANQILILGTDSELFKIPGHAGVIAFALSQKGQAVLIRCDGTGFKITATAPALMNTTGVITIADRLSTPPSAEAGARYILTSSPLLAWSTFAEHDIAEANGQGGWFKITPPTDSGWHAYVQDEDADYTFIGSAWVQNNSSDTVAGRIPRATAAQMETGTAVDVAVTPGRQHSHPGHPKFWLVARVSGAVPTLTASYNITSITDTATGRMVITIATDFSTDAGWACFIDTESNSGTTGKVSGVSNGTKAAGSVEVFLRDLSAGTLVDPDSWYVMGLGDQ